LPPLLRLLPEASPWLSRLIVQGEVCFFPKEETQMIEWIRGSSLLFRVVVFICVAAGLFCCIDPVVARSFRDILLDSWRGPFTNGYVQTYEGMTPQIAFLGNLSIRLSTY
jgi:hypothetical protein